MMQEGGKGRFYEHIKSRGEDRSKAQNKQQGGDE